MGGSGNGLEIGYGVFGARPGDVVFVAANQRYSAAVALPASDVQSRDVSEFFSAYLWRVLSELVDQANNAVTASSILSSQLGGLTRQSGDATKRASVHLVCRKAETVEGETRYSLLAEISHMNPKNFINRENLILGILAAGCFIATATLVPNVGNAEMDKVKASMATLKAKTAKLGAPKIEGKDPVGGCPCPILRHDEDEQLLRCGR
jgi:hypothetical protein